MIEFGLYPMHALRPVLDRLGIAHHTRTRKPEMLAALAPHARDPEIAAMLDPRLIVPLCGAMNNTQLRHRLRAHGHSIFNVRKSDMVWAYANLIRQAAGITESLPQWERSVAPEGVTTANTPDINEQAIARIQPYLQAQTQAADRKYNLNGRIAQISRPVAVQGNRVVFYAHLTDRPNNRQDLLVSIPAVVMTKMVELVESIHGGPIPDNQPWPAICIFGYYFKRETFLHKDRHCASHGFRIISVRAQTTAQDSVAMDGAELIRHVVEQEATAVHCA